MNKKSLGLRVAAAGLGGLMLTAVAGAAFAAPEQQGSDAGVKVSVEIPANDGVLALTVAGTTAGLTETTPASDAANRVFTGKLPAVTVTDTRAADQIAANSFWYVVGSASQFTGTNNQTPIPASQLGWKPAVIDSEGTGDVAPGEEVLTSRDESTTPTGNNVGLVGKELLAMAVDSSAARETGQWTANADLTLKTGKNVAAGSYSSTLTLSLFEDIAAGE